MQRIELRKRSGREDSPGGRRGVGDSAWWIRREQPGAYGGAKAASYSNISTPDVSLSLNPSLSWFC